MSLEITRIRTQCLISRKLVHKWVLTGFSMGQEHNVTGLLVWKLYRPVCLIHLSDRVLFAVRSLSCCCVCLIVLLLPWPVEKVDSWALTPRAGMYGAAGVPLSTSLSHSPGFWSSHVDPAHFDLMPISALCVFSLPLSPLLSRPADFGRDWSSDFKLI